MKKDLIPFIAFWIADLVLLYLAVLFMPQYFTLGTYRLSTTTALIIASLVWTIIVWLVNPVLKRLKVEIKGTLQMAVFFWLANFAALWITARLAPYTGFGVSRFTWILGLALIANLVQFGIWKISKSKM